MLSEHEQESHFHRTARLDGVSSNLADRDGGSTDSQEGSLASLRSLVGSTGLRAHSNTSVRANLMQGMQQTHGNRAVQRYVQRSAANGAAPLPVQREEEEELKSPRITPLPNPKLELPFGGGLTGSVDPIETSVTYKRGKGQYKLGAEYEGKLVGEAKYGPWWAKAKYSKDGYGVGVGRGGPYITPPGSPPMINDPSGDMREGDPNPAKAGKSFDEIGEANKGPGVGVEVGKDKDRGTYVVVGGSGKHDIGGGGPIAKKRPPPKQHKQDGGSAPDDAPSVSERMTPDQLKKGIEEYKAQQRRWQQAIEDYRAQNGGFRVR